MKLALQVALLAAAGALGTLARAGTVRLVERGLGLEAFWGTAAVNGLGCFTFGLAWTLTGAWARVPGEARWIVLTGFMGAFTTFSTFAFDVTTLAQSGRWWAAAGNLMFQNALGVAAVLVGLSVGHSLTDG